MDSVLVDFKNRAAGLHIFSLLREETAAGATAGMIGADATALIVPSPATRRSRGSRKQGEGAPSVRGIL